MLHELRDHDVDFALHGRDHRTRYESPRRRRASCAVTAAAGEELLDGASAELREVGIEADVFIAPYNRFDARQYLALARRFAVICAAARSPCRCWASRTPLWRGEAVYLPSYYPVYGTAASCCRRPATDRSEPGIWVPIALHWGWEADGGWDDLRRLTEVIAPFTAPLDRLPRRGFRERARC